MERVKALEGIVRQAINNDIGMSASAIIDRYMNNGKSKHRSHPMDSSDFGRCFRLIKETGIDIHIMKGVSKEWDSISFNWCELCDSFLYGNESLRIALNECIR